MMIVTMTAIWFGKVWVLNQFQLLQDEPDVDIWEDENYPNTQTPQEQVPWEFESVISSEADTSTTDPWAIYNEDVWQEAERLAVEAIAKA